MRHRLSTIAQNYRFNEREFVKFAFENINRFSIEIDHEATEGSTVSTWYSNDLIEAYRKQ